MRLSINSYLHGGEILGDAPGSVKRAMRSKKYPTISRGFATLPSRITSDAPQSSLLPAMGMSVPARSTNQAGYFLFLFIQRTLFQVPLVVKSRERANSGKARAGVRMTDIWRFIPADPAADAKMAGAAGQKGAQQAKAGRSLQPS